MIKMKPLNCPQGQLEF